MKLLRILPLAGLLILAAGCKGRSSAVPEATGDTVEVVINQEDPTARVDAESDSAFSVSPEPGTQPDEVTHRQTVSPAEAAAALSGEAPPPVDPKVTRRQQQSDVNL